MHIIRGPGGMLEDNNDFALAMVMSIPFLVHISTSERRIALSKPMMMIVPLTMITVALTHSRGGFLAMCITFFVLVWRSRNRLGGLTVMMFLALAGAAMAPDSLVKRLETLKTSARTDRLRRASPRGVSRGG